ncbi:MAG TPA: phosphoribosyltransferase family protein [Solirubrobacteraceae bacterium]|nr:phosphoribosyltransferase family protein [Solirubrobacteraceae bacterium]
MAAALEARAPARPVVVALARGGAPLAFEVALALQAPLEILAVRKLGAPRNPELAIGAVAEDGTGVLDQLSIARLRVTDEMLDAALADACDEMDQRVRRYHRGRPSIPLRGRTAIVVDDGLATGLTDLAAVRAVRARGAERIVLAVPVGTSEAVALLEREADEVLCLQTPNALFSVGSWYRDFAPVSDEQVIELLAAAPSGAPADTDQ